MTDEERQMVDYANDIWVSNIQAELAKRHAPAPKWEIDIRNERTIIKCRGEYGLPERRIEISSPGHAEFASRLVSWFHNYSISPSQR